MLKYHQAEKLLLEKISKLPPGEPLPPIRQLIEESSFSQATIMKAISLLEQKNVIERRPGAGIFAACSAAGTIGSVAVLISIIDNSASSQILLGIQQALSGSGDQILLLPGGREVDKILPALKRNGIRKLILYPISSDLKNPEFLNFVEQLAEQEISVATIEIPIPGLKCVFAGQENTHAFEEVTKHLIQNGVRSIAVTGMFNSVIYASRLAGIRNAINASKHPILLKQIDEGDGGFAIDIAKKLLACKCDAILLCNADNSREIAYGLQALNDSLSEKITVAGVVEQNWRIPLPRAITLEKQSIELGRSAVQALAAHRVSARYIPMKIHYHND